MQARLKAVGITPKSLLVDITNYVLMETGHPLHAFDAARVEGAIVVRLPREGETFLALDGEEYRLADGDVVIADQSGVIALGGVMGGGESGVTE